MLLISYSSLRYCHVSSIQPLTLMRECMGMHGQPGSVTGATVMHRISGRVPGFVFSGAQWECSRVQGECCGSNYAYTCPCICGLSPQYTCGPLAMRCVVVQLVWHMLLAGWVTISKLSNLNDKNITSHIFHITRAWDDTLARWPNSCLYSYLNTHWRWSRLLGLHVDCEMGISLLRCRRFWWKFVGQKWLWYHLMTSRVVQMVSWPCIIWKP